MRRRLLACAIGSALVAGVLYLPIRRAVIDRGWTPAATFASKDGGTLTLFAPGEFLRNKDGRETRGRFQTERFADTPRISHLRLDDGEVLHVRYDEGAYQIENISLLSSADTDYKRR